MADEDVQEHSASLAMPFLLEVEQGLYLTRYTSVAVIGRAVRGAAQSGESLELVGFAPQPKRVVLRDILADGPLSPVYLLEEVSRQEVYPGQVLASPGLLQPATTFHADVLFDERYEQITQQPFQGVCRYVFHIRHTGIFGTLHLPPGKERIVHDDHFTATVDLKHHCALETGLRFGIGRLLGQGTVLEVIG